MVVTSERDANGMLPDGSNPEGVDPVPALGWTSNASLTEVVVHGPMFSWGTTKLRLLMLLNGVAYTHNEWLNATPQGIKPGPYNKVPVVDVAGRQVNDSGVIVKHLLPVFGMEFNQEWENRIVLELDTSIKLHTPARDWAKLAVKTMGMPWIMTPLLMLMLSRLERSQARSNIANSGLGHREGDEVGIAKQFAKEMGSKLFFHGDAPGHVDVSFYASIVGFLYSEASIGKSIVSGAKLEAWAERMQEKLPMKLIYVDSKDGYPKPV
jgi:glutathione S-transferase